MYCCLEFNIKIYFCFTVKQIYQINKKTQEIKSPERNNQFINNNKKYYTFKQNN